MPGGALRPDDSAEPPADDWQARYASLSEFERERGTPAMHFAMELVVENGFPAMKALLCAPGETIALATAPALAIDSTMARETVLERLHASDEHGLSKLGWLGVLLVVDRESFLPQAIEYLTMALRQSDQPIRDDDLWPAFLLDLHECDPQLIGELVAGTCAGERDAGRRLRRLCLWAVDECAEELGLLAAANLRELLENGLSTE